MSFIAEREGFIGKVLLYMKHHEIDDFPEAGEDIHNDFIDRFNNNDYEYELPDEEKANDYVEKFATLHDYVIPFRTDDPPVSNAERIEMLDWIDKALELDPHCYDAIRIKCFVDNEIHSPLPQEDDYAYLMSRKEEARLWSMSERNRILIEECGFTKDEVDEADDLSLLPEGVDLKSPYELILLNRAVYPYLRWLSSLADCAYHLGRYGDCIQHVTEALLIQRSDPGDIRRIGYLAAAKLQDEEALDIIAQACPYKEDSDPLWEYHKDAWYLLACLYLNYVNLRIDEAKETLNKIFEIFPGAEDYIYDEITIGRTVYAYPEVAPHSSEELLLALSYGKPLLLEGAVTPFSMCLIAWIHQLRDEGEIKDILGGLDEIL